MRKFWVVLKDGTSQVTRRHVSLQSATEEARRLLNKEAPATFYILEAKAMWRIAAPPIEHYELTEEK